MRNRIAHLFSSTMRVRRAVSLGLVLAAALTVSAHSATSVTSASAEQAALTATGDWAAAIDARWGPGLPTERKLEIFDAFWTTIDERFAAFQDLDVDWAALRDRYRPEIAAGVSRGRFAAIMSHLALALREFHTIANDLTVLNTPRSPGVPLMVLRQPSNNFGACATAQPDGSALIYDVTPGHPLGVEPGDRILGYEGRPWRELYPELLAAELPVIGGRGSSPSSFEHVLVQSAVANWHLFDTIDIWKHDSGTVEHLSTAPLNTTPQLRSRFCTEQLAVPGVPKPAVASDVVTWGVIDGTRIGYIYVSAWQGDAGPLFTEAVEEVTQERETDGLIIDFRFNPGGNMFLSDAGLGMLFDRPIATIAFAERADPTDHFKMRMAAPPYIYVIDMYDNAFDPRAYDKPIAVLTGPGAGSSGDQVALRMTYHPRARTFGKTTNTAFNAPCSLDVGDPAWSIRYACADAYRVDDPHDYLTHDEFVVDEPVWLRPDDVAQGKDTVVDAALRWIDSKRRRTRSCPVLGRAAVHIPRWSRPQALPSSD
jgi:Peptidase family S41/Tricorn protease C1 domain